jgi:hypothetical protein
MEDVIEILNECEEEDFDLVMPRTRGPTKVRDRVDHFTKWDELEFFDRFRMHKRTANIVLESIQQEISTKTMKNRAVSPALQLLTCLRFYATGSFLITVGELSGLHYSTTSKIIKRVSIALARKCPQVIKMPSNEEEVKEVISGFYDKARFPNCIGALDCTHVKIQSPGGNNAEYYRNRKGIFSINVQNICDSNLTMQNIVARWPGSTHDSHIFNSSRIRREFENGNYGNRVLVGDSGYACTNYLITPLDSVNTPEENLFQESIVRTRNPIERCYGVWKRRFPILSLGIRLNLDRVESIIVATAVLHNICIREKEDVPPVDEEIQDAIEALEVVEQPQHNRRRRETERDRNLIVRNNLINNYFRSLLVRPGRPTN